MIQTTENVALANNDDSLHHLRNIQRQEGQRFLRFSLQTEVDGLIPLIDLQGTIEVILQDILPVPQVPEIWLGIVNYQGEATWIIDLAGLLGASHWCRREVVPKSGLAMLIKIDKQIVGLLVEEIKGIETYDSQLCLPATDLSLSEKLKSLLKGYFLDSKHNSLMLLDIQNIVNILQV